MNIICKNLNKLFTIIINTNKSYYDNYYHNIVI